MSYSDKPGEEGVRNPGERLSGGAEPGSKDMSPVSELKQDQNWRSWSKSRLLLHVFHCFYPNHQINQYKPLSHHVYSAYRLNVFSTDSKTQTNNTCFDTNIYTYVNRPRGNYINLFYYFYNHTIRETRLVFMENLELVSKVRKKTFGRKILTSKQHLVFSWKLDHNFLTEGYNFKSKISTHKITTSCCKIVTYV